jgi:hypothetical protein
MKNSSIERYKEITQNAAQHAGNSINSSLSGQTFNCCHEDKDNKRGNYLITGAEKQQKLKNSAIIRFFEDILLPVTEVKKQAL